LIRSITFLTLAIMVFPLGCWLSIGAACRAPQYPSSPPKIGEI
jgi:hypothetical protein